VRALIVFIVMVILLVIGWLFAAANTAPVTINYLIGSSQLRLSYGLLAVFVLGFVVGVIYCGYGLLKARLANRRLRDRCAAQEAELQRLNAQLARHAGR
jgi:uncharacterized membrane protein YciS (DUF1049 family)